MWAVSEVTLRPIGGSSTQYSDDLLYLNATANAALSLSHRCNESQATMCLQPASIKPLQQLFSGMHTAQQELHLKRYGIMGIIAHMPCAVSACLQSTASIVQVEATMQTNLMCWLIDNVLTYLSKGPAEVFLQQRWQPQHPRNHST